MGYRKRERRRRKIDTWKAKGSAITVSKDLSVLFANDVAFLFFFFFWHIPFCTCIVFLVFLLSISIGLLYSTYFVHLRYDNTTETVIFDCQGNTGKPGRVWHRLSVGRRVECLLIISVYYLKTWNDIEWFCVWIRYKTFRRPRGREVKPASVMQC